MGIFLAPHDRSYSSMGNLRVPASRWFQTSASMLWFFAGVWHTQTVVFKPFFGNYPCPKTNMAMEHHHYYIIGNTSSNDWFSIVMFVSGVYPSNSGDGFSSWGRFFNWVGSTTNQLRSLPFVWENFWPHKSLHNISVVIVGIMGGTKKHLLSILV